jgi:DNA-binding HxlR family transcriptional regulator
LAGTHKTVRDAHVMSECKIVSEMLSRIGDKWTVLVVGVLSDGTLRYGEIQKAVEGISQRMLTLTLKSLEADGLVRRKVTPTIPPRVDYSLTPLGKTLTKPLRALYEWTIENRKAILEARKKSAKVNS